jgi:hypothetical protein
MCGRITLTRPNLESIAAELDVEAMNYRGYPLLEPHYNIAPTSIHCLTRRQFCGVWNFRETFQQGQILLSFSGSTDDVVRMHVVA